MKKRSHFIYLTFMLIFATLACQIPTCSDIMDVFDIDMFEAKTDATVDEIVFPTSTTAATNTQTPSPTATETVTLDLPVYSSPKLSSLAMFTETQGWALADQKDVILVTVDGGETWLNATPPELDLAPGGVILGIRPFFLDEAAAWFTPNISGSALLYRTQDSGQNWTKTTLPFNYANYYFRTVNEGFALVDLGAGAGSHYIAIYRTMDGGQSWSEIFTHEPGEIKSLPEGGSKNGITFLDEDKGWIGGNRPMTDDFYLYLTLDGGRTWEQEMDISLPDTYSGSFLDVWPPFFPNNITGYLFIRALTPSSDSYLLIYRTDDAGETWTYQNSIKDGRSVDFISDREGWVVAADAIYQTTDGGQTWSLADASGIPAGDFFLSIDFVDGQHGWAVTTPDESTWDPRNLYRTTDGGEVWTLLSP